MAVTLKDIARECGLAVSTVSNILNDHKDSYASERVKKQVKETAEALGYRKHYLSVSLRTRRTLSIGLCLDYLVYETRRYFVNSFVDAFSRAGYEVAITTHEMDPERAIDSLRFFEERFKDGVVLFTDFLRDIGEGRELLIQTLRQSSAKILGIGSEFRGVVPSLDIQRTWAFDSCIRRYKRDGHRKIIVVYKTPADFRESFTKLQAPAFVHMNGVYSADDFRSRWPELWRQHSDATAVFFRSDEIAIPALSYFAANGPRVPDQLCVTSFDHFRFSEYTSPPLTTYDINFDKLGRMTFDCLHRWITGECEPAADFYKTLRPTPVDRQSHSRSSMERKRT
jgi:LacI family transcriptional regulator, sucrose operon repressor